jgi:hypothetical protein
MIEYLVVRQRGSVTITTKKGHSMHNYVKPAILSNEIQTISKMQGTGGFPISNCDSSIDCPDQDTNSRLGVVECSNDTLEIIVFLSGSELSSDDLFSACEIEGISGLNFNGQNCTLTESPLICQDGHVYDFQCDLSDVCPSPDATVVLNCAGYQTQGNCSVQLN